MDGRVGSDDRRNAMYETSVYIENPTDNQLAFMVFVSMEAEYIDDDVYQESVPIAPVFWDDNFICVFPNESRTINGKYNVNIVPNGATVVPKLALWNNLKI